MRLRFRTVLNSSFWPLAAGRPAAGSHRAWRVLEQARVLALFERLPGVDVRDGANPVLASARRWLGRVNARHPRDHNEHFHGWILRNLPARRRPAVDVGCGTGVLAGKLAPHFTYVTGIDPDAGMAAASTRLAHDRG